MTRPFTAELELAVACCRWPDSPERDRAIRQAAERVTDWEQFDRLVARHRIAPLARDGLTSAGVALPATIEQRLAARGAQGSLNSLMLARESVRLQRAFEEAGVPALIIKGAAVAWLAYGDVGMKESWDIDLLTSEDEVRRAQSVLQSLGYELAYPERLTAAQFRLFTRYAIESVYRHRDSGANVELHWRATHNRRLIPGAGVHGRTQRVGPAGAELVTFADDTLFAYLCVHGTRHGWVRLKWLADVGALLAGRSPDEIARLYRAAVDAGAGRAPAATLLLCRQLLGTPIPEDLALRLEGDPKARFLEATALDLIRGRWQPTGIPTLPPLRWVYSKFLVAPGGRYVREEMRNLWNRPMDRVRFGAPLAGLLFHLLRIPVCLGRLTLRAGNSMAAHAKAGPG
jgi:hypothetical protein